MKALLLVLSVALCGCSRLPRSSLLDEQHQGEEIARGEIEIALITEQIDDLRERIAVMRQSLGGLPPVSIR